MYCLSEYCHFLTKILDQNIFPNSFIINQIISKLSRQKELEYVLEFHAIAVLKKLADSITYNSTIAVIAKCERPNLGLALKLLKEAKALGFANSITYASTIDVIAKCGRPDVGLAMTLLEEAKSLGFANSITYTSTIDVIAKCGRPDVGLAITLLEEAKKFGLANIITYNNTIDAIAKCERPDEKQALFLLDEVLSIVESPDIFEGENIDLHNLSFGTVYFGLKRRLQNELQHLDSQSISLDLIYGKGLHSRTSVEQAGAHPLKKAVQRLTSEMSELGISGSEDEGNPGIFHLTITKPDLKLAPK